MQNRYKDLIFTNHALERMKERGIKQGDVWATWKRPDSSRYSKIKGAYIYYKTWKDQKIEVIAKRNEKKEWIVLSVWLKLFKDNKTKRRHCSLIRLIAKLFEQ